METFQVVVEKGFYRLPAINVANRRRKIPSIGRFGRAGSLLALCRPVLVILSN
ncbi:hypothetical protein [Halomonas maura]|uniref:hypothetical protein n=1 Tax=Halomonas maura TaxID=117606 RepID=UPI0025B50334|nr:hypothetical protein [Halomonas maura]MDN3557528.1 hypothetical protein [Halomonas maura]